MRGFYINSKIIDVGLMGFMPFLGRSDGCMIGLLGLAKPMALLAPLIPVIDAIIRTKTQN